MRRAPIIMSGGYVAPRRCRMTGLEDGFPAEPLPSGLSPADYDAARDRLGRFGMHMLGAVFIAWFVLERLGWLVMTATAMPSYASMEEMEQWARGVMRSRRPDYIIGENYLRRWWITPRNEFSNVYLHEFLSSDDDRAFHDHPWANSSFILSGRYIEHTPEGQFVRVAGDFVERPAEALHRVELIGNQPVISLFMTGAKVREWGFACPQGWVHWEDFTSPTDSSRTGRGCGET